MTVQDGQRFLGATELDQDARELTGRAVLQRAPIEPPRGSLRGPVAGQRVPRIAGGQINQAFVVGQPGLALRVGLRGRANFTEQLAGIGEALIELHQRPQQRGRVSHLVRDPLFATRGQDRVAQRRLRAIGAAQGQLQPSESRRGGTPQLGRRARRDLREPRDRALMVAPLPSRQQLVDFSMIGGFLDPERPGPSSLRFASANPVRARGQIDTDARSGIDVGFALEGDGSTIAVELDGGLDWQPERQSSIEPEPTSRSPANHRTAGPFDGEGRRRRDR